MSANTFSNSGQFGEFLQDPLDLAGGRSGGAAIAAQTQAANQANETARYTFDTQRADLAPWREAGTKALDGLQDPNFGKNLEMDPGYQFRMDEGSKAINAAAAARGMGNSGATMKALTKYGQDYSSNEYNNAYNRNMTRLTSLAGLGSGANSQGVEAAGSYGSTVAGNQVGLGNAIASQQLAQANGNKQLAGQVGGAVAGGIIKGMFSTSDRRLKKEIKLVSKEDLAEMKKYLTAYTFKYTSEDFGKGEWAGVMAQDLEKSKLGRTLVVEDENGHKHIDIRKVMSLFLATLAEG
jgi:hypothetical protein